MEGVRAVSTSDRAHRHGEARGGAVGIKMHASQRTLASSCTCLASAIFWARTIFHRFHAAASCSVRSSCGRSPTSRARASAGAGQLAHSHLDVAALTTYLLFFLR